MAEEEEEDVWPRRPEEGQNPLEARRDQKDSRTGKYPKLDSSMCHDNGLLGVEC
jgi:hypothetical protein